MKKVTFEEGIRQLEKIVNELEAGDMPLEDAVKKYEEGIRISKLCNQKLDETEKKIMILAQDSDGNVIDKPFLSDEE